MSSKNSQLSTLIETALVAAFAMALSYIPDFASWFTPSFGAVPVVLFALETAMRRGELLSLTWKDVDLKKRVAYLEITKNGTARAVPLSSRAVAVLESLKEEKDGVQALSVGKVFKTTDAALKKAFERACERAGINDFHFHDLRHEATSRLAEKLPNLIELAAVTGHKDLRMLKRYYHPRAEDLARKLG